MVTSFGASINSFTQDSLPTYQDILYIGQYLSGNYTDGYVTKQDLKKDIVTSVSATYTILPNDETILCDGTSAAFTVTLPSAVGIAGVKKTIKKIDSSGNAITIGTTGGQTIDGSATKSLATQYKTMIVISNNSNWLITASF